MNTRLLITDQFRFVDTCEPEWIRDLWRSDVEKEKLSAFFVKLAFIVRSQGQGRWQSLLNDNRAPAALRRGSVLAADLCGKTSIESYRDLGQWLTSAASKKDPAFDSIAQLRQPFRSWAYSFMAKPDYFTVDQTNFAYVCKTLLDSGYNLEQEYNWVFGKVEAMREHFIRSCQTKLQPDTLRNIIALRILNIYDKDAETSDSKNTLPSNLEHIDPISVSILDTPLSTNRINVIDRVLPRISNFKLRELYHGICLKVCLECWMPKFHILHDDVHPILSRLSEFPQNATRQTCVYHGKVCSSCQFKWLIKDIYQEWWNNLAYDTWLKPRCSPRCSVNKSIANLRDIAAHIHRFDNVDPEARRKAIDMYDSRD
ncbi:hypothetical protein GQ44DRAFT_774849 [Phaeosphaeriaceae sp. PMI808]|nr:hypothetical protein GQ44DRAFT_774849 [Phaeosphaeriaceae sp. PMI808]